MFVKICGITHPSDALAAVDAGADAIGCNFVPTSRRRIDVVTARRIVALVPDDVMVVGVFMGHSAEEVLEVTGVLGLDAAQLHGHEPPDVVAAVAAGVDTVIDVVVAGDPAMVSIDTYDADIVMVDAPTPGGGVPFDWELVGDIVTSQRILLAGGLRPDNVARAISRVRPWGVDVASGVEAGTGRKDPAAMERFVAAARAAARRPTE